MRREREKKVVILLHYYYLVQSLKYKNQQIYLSSKSETIQIDYKHDNIIKTILE